jgi:hypothetical protein
MKELEVNAIFKDCDVPAKYKAGGVLNEAFLDGVEHAERKLLVGVPELWVARDHSGDLNLFLFEPIKNEQRGVFEGSDNYGQVIRLHSGTYPELTFKNSPLRVKLILNDIKNGK